MNWCERNERYCRIDPLLNRSLGYGALICVSLLVLFGCTTPSGRFHQEVAELGFRALIVQASEFRHLLLIKPGAKGSRELHVYLEGDGIPWIQRRLVAKDPTPREPLMLRLMSLDVAPSLYLGRPCYHGMSDEPGCSPVMWTFARYSEEVVASMSVALREVLQSEFGWVPGQVRGKTQVQSLVFLGHSGGGTLAMLLAERFAQARAVVTLAGNLDPQVWAAYHGYTPLAGSLNPTRRLALRPNVLQLHFAGTDDDRVPVGIVGRAIAHQPNTVFVTVEGFDHSCCWSGIWPKILAVLRDDTHLDDLDDVVIGY